MNHELEQYKKSLNEALALAALLDAEHTEKLINTLILVQSNNISDFTNLISKVNVVEGDMTNFTSKIENDLLNLRQNIASKESNLENTMLSLEVLQKRIKRIEECLNLNPEKQSDS